MSDTTATLPDRLAPRTDRAASALRTARALAAIPVRVARFVGFWTAVAVPFAYLPLLAGGLPGGGAETFAGLVAANCVGLVLGRNYGRDRVGAPAPAPASADRAAAETGEGDTGASEAGTAADADGVDTGTDDGGAARSDDTDARADDIDAHADDTDARADDTDEAPSPASDAGEERAPAPARPRGPGESAPERATPGAAD